MNENEKEVQEALGTLSTYVASGSSFLNVTLAVSIPFSITVRAGNDEDAEAAALSILKEMSPKQRKELILSTIDDFDTTDIVDREQILTAVNKCPAEQFAVYDSETFHYIQEREAL